MKKEKALEKISDSFGIPREIIGNIPKIVITGEGLVHIEGFRGLEEYTDEVISVKFSGGVFSVKGEKLNICEITDEYIDVCGIVKSVEFM